MSVSEDKVAIYRPGKRPESRDFHELPPLSLYIHLPWCLQKCPYCDFNSHALGSEPLPENAYIDALLADLTTELPAVWGRQIHSVFIGGGTPSLFSPESLDRLLSGVRALTAITPGTEITMEANPGTFEQQKFAEFNDIGINRLSLGIQSFDDDHLKALGRVHGSNESLQAAFEARDAGFDNINLDLMFGLPGQTKEQAMRDLSLAIEASPNHISYYQLTLEPNTLFHKYPPILPDHDRLWSIQEQAIDHLQAAGFSRYEISAWANNGKTSTHNMNYWQYGDYIGIGAGAHGKISRADNGTITRRIKQKHPQHYLANAGLDAGVVEEKQVPIGDTALEFTLNALRLIEGFTPPLFNAHTGTDLMFWDKQFRAAEDAGLLEYTALEIKPTPKGTDFLNELLEFFIPESE